MILAFLLRILYFVFLVFLLRRLVQLLRGRRPTSAAGQRTAAFQQPATHVTMRGKMVQDPVCQTYVDPALAVVERAGGTTHYFCSAKCMQAYKDQSRC